MVKVIAAIAQSPYAGQMQAQISDLVTWTSAILDGCYRFADPLIHNYINDTCESACEYTDHSFPRLTPFSPLSPLPATFRDAAGSAMIAYATYRLASLSPGNNTHIAAADTIYAAVQDKLTPMGIFDSSVEVPDALTFTQPAQMSPESLSFLVLMSAARRDYMQSNVTGVGGVGTGSQTSTSSSSSAAATAQLQTTTWSLTLLFLSLSLALSTIVIL